MSNFAHYNHNDMQSADEITRRFFELDRWQRAMDTAALFEAVKPMKDVDVPGRQKSAAWMDAYKGAGAYFTMKNLILFHNCTLHLDNGQVLDRDASFSYIQQLNANPAVGGQQMFAVMLRLIADNNFDWHD